MKNIITLSGTVLDVRRMPSSLNGNPRYAFTIDGRRVCTAVDSSWGYSLPNHDGKLAIVRAGMHYGKLTLAHIEAHS
jgi:hypothetical protein